MPDNIQPDSAQPESAQPDSAQPGDNELTLSESTEPLEADGFTGRFAIGHGASVLCRTCGRHSLPQEVSLEALRRTEGTSDPDDMVAIAALICPHCAARGTLLLHFGALADEDESQVLRLLDDARDHRTSGGTSVACQA